jgi:acyl-CoA dehydrogenase family protein 9
MQDYPYERMLRDSRINMIYEGTNEVLRVYLGLAGLQTPGGQAAGNLPVTRAHPVLAREAGILRVHAAELRDRIDETVRLCGRAIVDKQHAHRRVADMAMELYAIAACLSRTTSAIEKQGEATASREIELCRSVVASAERRLDGIVRSYRDNDDDQRDAVASHACADGGYPLDVWRAL